LYYNAVAYFEQMIILRQHTFYRAKVMVEKLWVI